RTLSSVLLVSLRSVAPPRLFLFSLYSSVAHRDLPSFPTRRSSDLLEQRLDPDLGGLDLARGQQRRQFGLQAVLVELGVQAPQRLDRKSTRLNSSHQIISYAVFCLKKKKENNIMTTTRRTKHRKQVN